MRIFCSFLALIQLLNSLEMVKYPSSLTICRHIVELVARGLPLSVVDAAIISALLNIDNMFITIQRDAILAYYSAGCSMTKSINGKRRLPSTLKKSFSSTSFRYGKFLEPHGKKWRQLRSLLRGKIELTPFKTFWKCIGFSLGPPFY